MLIHKTTKLLKSLVTPMFWKNKKHTESQPEEYEGYNLNSPLFYFSDNDPWTIGDACEGTQVFGGTGSGKTSGIGKLIATSFLESEMGGLILTAKKDEVQLWKDYCEATDRTESLLIVSPKSEWRFNFLDYELNRDGAGSGITENIVNLFITLMSVADSNNSSSEDYWQRTVKQLLRNAIDLLSITRGSLTLKEIYKIITTAPKSKEEVEDPEFLENSFCGQLILESQEQEYDDQANDLELSIDYWLNEYPNLSDKTRSIIVSTFTSMADSFLRSPLNKMFCSDTTFTPEMSMDGIVILMDLPVKEYHETGRYAQVLFKYLWQKAVERRNIKENDRPVFLWADESQFFITSNDMDFQTTARGSRACTVYLTQNLPNYISRLGYKANDEVNSFLGNLQTKVFCQNSDNVTNQYASELIGKQWEYRDSFSSSYNNRDGDLSFNASSSSATISQTLEYQVLPTKFLTLPKGGDKYDYLVGAVVFQGGRVWNGSRVNWLEVRLSQK